MSMNTARVMQSHVRSKLRKLCAIEGRGFSAGAMAKEMGLARGTVLKHLSTLVGEGRVKAYVEKHVNKQQMTLYWSE